MVEFHCSAIGNPVPEIKWIKDGQTMKKADTLSFAVNRNQSGQYWCSADNGFNTVDNASAYLDVLCKFRFSLCSYRLSLNKTFDCYRRV